jgi:hypothetical protein
MSGAVLVLPPYVFMAWHVVKYRDNKPNSELALLCMKCFPSPEIAFEVTRRTEGYGLPIRRSLLVVAGTFFCDVRSGSQGL